MPPSPSSEASALALTEWVARIHDQGLTGEVVVEVAGEARRLQFVDGELHFTADHPLAQALAPVLAELGPLASGAAATGDGAARLRALMTRIAFLFADWSNLGEATFRPLDRAAVADGAELVGPLPTALLRMEWAATGDDGELLRRIGGEDRLLTPTPQRSAPAAGVARLLDPHASVLLARLSRPTSLSDLLRQSSTPRSTVLADVARLCAAGLLEVMQGAGEGPAEGGDARSAEPSLEVSRSRSPQEPAQQTPVPERSASPRPAPQESAPARPSLARSPSASPLAPAPTSTSAPISPPASDRTPPPAPYSRGSGSTKRTAARADGPGIGIAPRPASKDVVHRYAERVGRELADWPLSLDAESHRSRLGDLLARAAGLTAYELLDVDGTATESEIHEGFQRLARLVHPGHAERLALAGGDRPLWFLFEQSVSAYLTLSQVDRRRRYDQRLQGMAATGPAPAERSVERKELARSYYQRAAALLDAEDFHFAVELLKQAVQTHPTPEYYVLLGRAQAKNPNWLRHALDSYRKAVDLGADDSRVSVALGRICEAQENWDEARRHYEAALAKNPTEPDARAGLARLAGREADEAEGEIRRRWSIGSLFRRRR